MKKKQADKKKKAAKKSLKVKSGVQGGPHYTTFGGSRYNFYSQGDYQLSSDF